MQDLLDFVLNPRFSVASSVVESASQIAKLKHQICCQRSARSSRLIAQLALTYDELEREATEDELAAERGVAKQTENGRGAKVGEESSPPLSRRCAGRDQRYRPQRGTPRALHHQLPFFQAFAELARHNSCRG